VGLTSRGTTEEPACDGPGVFTDPTYGPFRVWIFTTILRRKIEPCTCPLQPARDAAGSTRVGRLKPLIVA
jgi:hypothetical protein